MNVQRDGLNPSPWVFRAVIVAIKMATITTLSMKLLQYTLYAGFQPQAFLRSVHSRGEIR
jgi:hypothetical protein